MLLHITLQIMFAYLILFAALFNIVNLCNARFFATLLNVVSLYIAYFFAVFANAFCFHAILGLHTHSFITSNTILHHAQCF